MKEDFKKWCCVKAGYVFDEHSLNILWENKEIEILIKAMWAINREYKKTQVTIQWNDDHIMVWNDDGRFETEPFDFKDHNNSELEALTACLQYIFDNKDK